MEEVDVVDTLYEKCFTDATSYGMDDPGGHQSIECLGLGTSQEFERILGLNQVHVFTSPEREDVEGLYQEHTLQPL